MNSTFTIDVEEYSVGVGWQKGLKKMKNLLLDLSVGYYDLRAKGEADNDAYNNLPAGNAYEAYNFNPSGAVFGAVVNYQFSKVDLEWRGKKYTGDDNGQDVDFTHGVRLGFNIIEGVNGNFYLTRSSMQNNKDTTIQFSVTGSLNTLAKYLNPQK